MALPVDDPSMNNSHISAWVSHSGAGSSPVASEIRSASAWAFICSSWLEVQVELARFDRPFPHHPSLMPQPLSAFVVAASVLGCKIGCAWK